MRVREGGPADLPAIRRIARASFDRVYGFFAARGIKGAWPLLVAEGEDTSVAGFLEGKLFDGAPPIGYIYFVAVDPDYRRRGVASMLLSEALHAFDGRGVTRVFAAVPRNNAASLQLFASFGFHRTPRRALRLWYGWRGLLIPLRMLIAPRETLLVRTFTDPSPAPR